MKVYRVKLYEVLVSTYEVEAEDEEDAVEAVRSGYGVEIDRDTESMPEGIDDTAAEEIGSSTEEALKDDE